MTVWIWKKKNVHESRIKGAKNVHVRIVLPATLSSCINFSTFSLFVHSKSMNHTLYSLRRAGLHSSNLTLKQLQLEVYLWSLCLGTNMICTHLLFCCFFHAYKETILLIFCHQCQARFWIWHCYKQWKISLLCHVPKNPQNKTSKVYWTFEARGCHPTKSSKQFPRAVQGHAWNCSLKLRD